MASGKQLEQAFKLQAHLSCLRNQERAELLVFDTVPLHSFAVFSSSSEKVKRNDLGVKRTVEKKRIVFAEG